MIDSNLNRLAIGTVQFGVPYGISAGYQKTSEAHVKAILEWAAQNGIRVIDTAATYGQAEEILGRVIAKPEAFQVVTKLPSFQGRSGDLIQEADRVFLGSCQRLKHAALHGLLLHDSRDLLGPNGDALFDFLCAQKAEGLVRKVGISAYEAREIEAILSKYSIDLIQVPINILDQRLIHDGTLRTLKSMGVEVHARSIFLQGLLLMQEQDIPDTMCGAKMAIRDFHQHIAALNLSPLQAAIGFVKQVPELDNIVIGFHLLSQLQECIDIFSQPCEHDFASLAQNDLEILDPRTWAPWS